MDVFQSILQREGIRQLPGICWYPAERTAFAVNQGGTADGFYSPLTEGDFCQGRFCFLPTEISLRRKNRITYWRNHNAYFAQSGGGQESGRRGNV